MTTTATRRSEGLEAYIRAIGFVILLFALGFVFQVAKADGSKGVALLLGAWFVGYTGVFLVSGALARSLLIPRSERFRGILRHSLFLIIGFAGPSVVLGMWLHASMKFTLLMLLAGLLPFMSIVYRARRMPAMGLLTPLAIFLSIFYHNLLHGRSADERLLEGVYGILVMFTAATFLLFIFRRSFERRYEIYRENDKS